MLILECSQGCYGRKDGSVTISLRNFVGEGITMRTKNLKEFWKLFKNDKNRDPSKISIDSLIDFFKDLNTNKSDRDEYVNIKI